MDIDADFVRHALSYDAETGEFTWRNPGKTANKCYRCGVAAGAVSSNGRVMISVGGKLRQAHRLAWLYQFGEWPSMWLDHIDGNPQNNRISNLRLASATQNNANRKLCTRNHSGFKGVSLHAQSGKWRARLRIQGKLHSLGLYQTREEAHEAYMQAAEKFFGEFARAA